MMSDIRIIVDPIARRWQVARSEQAGLTIPAPSGDHGIALGRDAHGAVVEIVIDAVRPGPAGLDLVAQHFGARVRDEIASLDPSHEHDRVLTVSSTAVVSTGASAVMTTPGEDVSVLDLDGARASVSLHGHVLRVVLSAAATTGWIRVTSAGSGALVATMPIHIDQVSGDHRAECTFALDIPVEQLRFEAVDDPFSTVARATRVAERVDALLADAERTGRRRPGRAARIADGAALLADSIADDARRSAARYLAAGMRRAVRSRMLIALATVAALVAVVLGVTIGGGSTSSSSAVGSATVSPGPIIADFPNGDSVRMAMVGGSTDVVPGGQWMMGLIEFTTRETGVFGTISEDPGVAAQRCNVGAPVEMTVGAMSNVTVMVELWPLSGQGGPMQLIGPVPANPQQEFRQAVPNSCGEVTELDGQFVAKYSLARAGQSAGFDVPSGIAPGLWETRLSMDGVAADSVTGGIVINVLND